MKRHLLRTTTHAAALAALLLLLAAPASAQVRAVSDGFVSVEGAQSSTAFELRGKGLRLSGQAREFAPTPTSRGGYVPAGARVDLRSYFSGSALGSGPATVAGQSYARVHYGGRVVFNGAATAAAGVVVAPFRLSGYVEGYPESLTTNTSPALFRVVLKGRGLAVVEFAEAAPGALYVRRVTYQFHHRPLLDLLGLFPLPPNAPSVSK